MFPGLFTIYTRHFQKIRQLQMQRELRGGNTETEVDPAPNSRKQPPYHGNGDKFCSTRCFFYDYRPRCQVNI